MLLKITGNLFFWPNQGNSTDPGRCLLGICLEPPDTCYQTLGRSTIGVSRGHLGKLSTVDRSELVWGKDSKPENLPDKSKQWKPTRTPLKGTLWDFAEEYFVSLRQTQTWTPPSKQLPIRREPPLTPLPWQRRQRRTQTVSITSGWSRPCTWTTMDRTQRIWLGRFPQRSRPFRMPRWSWNCSHRSSLLSQVLSSV